MRVRPASRLPPGAHRHDIARHARPLPLFQLARENTGHLSEAKRHGLHDRALQVTIRNVLRTGIDWYRGVPSGAIAARFGRE